MRPAAEAMEAAPEGKGPPGGGGGGGGGEVSSRD